MYLLSLTDCTKTGLSPLTVNPYPRSSLWIITHRCISCSPEMRITIDGYYYNSTFKLLVYESLNELNHHYMNKLFSYTQENHSYGTRNATSSLLALPKCKKSIGQKCILYSGPKVWNGLTEAIRCAPSLPSFKSLYLKPMDCTTL